MSARPGMAQSETNARLNSRHVVVIGACIVGVCSALALLRAGFRVTLLERDAPGQGASFGNGAVIGEEAVIPVATPGILRRVPGMLLDPLGPLALRWSYLPRIAPWLLRFAAASRPKRVEAISIALAALLEGTLAAFDRLLEAADAADMLRRTGWLCVYETEAGLEAYRPMVELQRRRGVRFDILDRDAVREFEPALAPIFARAVYYRTWATPSTACAWCRCWPRPSGAAAAPSSALRRAASRSGRTARARS